MAGAAVEEAAGVRKVGCAARSGKGAGAGPDRNRPVASGVQQVPPTDDGPMHRAFTAGTSGSRRSFLAALASAAFLPLARPAPLEARHLSAWCGPARRLPPGPHPEPRPGITGARVLTAEQLATTPDLVPLFDKVRELPQIMDGIRCHCQCTDPPTFYSLLSCYEGEGMSRFCDICQGQASLAHRLHHAGESLDSIRAAIDARYGTS